MEQAKPVYEMGNIVFIISECFNNVKIFTFMVYTGTQGRLCIMTNFSEISADIMYVDVKQFVHKNEDNDIQRFYAVEINR